MDVGADRSPPPRLEQFNAFQTGVFRPVGLHGVTSSARVKLKPERFAGGFEHLSGCDTFPTGIQSIGM